jgi:tRNA pseudouridine38-40 synthase
MGASRTDAGVHALGQRAHLVFKNVPEADGLEADSINAGGLEADCIKADGLGNDIADDLCTKTCRQSSLQSPLQKIPLNKLPQVLNSMLPKDIAVTAAKEVPDSFHPIWDAKSKTYVYKICNHSHRNPLLWPYSAFVPTPLDVYAMQEACKFFIGRHDFAAFCAAGSSAKTTVREIYHLCVSRQNSVIEITVNGNGFLYNMVRIIAGTLVFVGLGKIKPDDIPDIILSKDRTKAGKTMPAKGLILLEIFY